MSAWSHALEAHRLTTSALRLGAVMAICSGLLLVAWGDFTSPSGITRRAYQSYVQLFRSHLRTLRKPWDPEPYLRMQIAACAIATATALGTARPLLTLAAMGLAVLPVGWLRLTRSQRLRAIDRQVDGFALTLANALRSTASIGDALRNTSALLAAPLRQELTVVLRQNELGSPMGQALLQLAGRVPSAPLEIVITELVLAMRLGGDLPTLLESTAASLREMRRLESLTEKVTLDAKRSLAVAAGTTLLMALFLPRFVPGFDSVFSDSLSGKLWAVGGAVAYLTAIAWGYRITRVVV